MAPTPTGTACCIARPRMRTSRTASASESAPAAASAEYSPTEWPATNCGVALEIDAGFGLEHAHRRQRHRHQRRLRILGQRHAFGRAFPHDGRELVAERRVDLVEDGARRGEGLGQRLAHADRLAALPRKHECDRHPHPFAPDVRPKTPRRSALSSRGHAGEHRQAKRVS